MADKVRISLNFPSNTFIFYTHIDKLKASLL